MLQTPLQRAVALSGGQSALARLIGTKQGNVWYWLNVAKRLPADYVLPIERATAGVVTRHDLRPDLYPVEQASAPKIFVDDGRAPAEPSDDGAGGGGSLR